MEILGMLISMCMYACHSHNHALRGWPSTTPQRGQHLWHSELPLRLSRHNDLPTVYVPRVIDRCMQDPKTTAAFYWHIF